MSVSANGRRQARRTRPYQWGQRYPSRSCDPSCLQKIRRQPCGAWRRMTTPCRYQSHYRAVASSCCSVCSRDQSRWKASDRDRVCFVVGLDLGPDHDLDLDLDLDLDSLDLDHDHDDLDHARGRGRGLGRDSHGHDHGHGHGLDRGRGLDHGLARGYCRSFPCERSELDRVCCRHRVWRCRRRWVCCRW